MHIPSTPFPHHPPPSLTHAHTHSHKHIHSPQPTHCQRTGALVAAHADILWQSGDHEQAVVALLVDQHHYSPCIISAKFVWEEFLSCP